MVSIRMQRELTDAVTRLDGAELLASDVAEGVSVTNGGVRMPKRFGNDVELFELVMEQ